MATTITRHKFKVEVLKWKLGGKHDRDIIAEKKGCICGRPEDDKIHFDIDGTKL